LSFACHFAIIHPSNGSCSCKASDNAELKTKKGLSVKFLMGSPDNPALSVCHFLPNLNQKKAMTFMMVRFSPRLEDLQRLQVCPIGPPLPSFATLVAQQGYCSVTGWLKVRLVAKLSRWLKQHRVPLNKSNETQIAAFFNARWKRLQRHVGDQTTMALLLRHLRQANVVAPPPERSGQPTDAVFTNPWTPRTIVVTASEECAPTSPA
jgi:hypothetical protein